ncbi:MAG: hypothetical protein GXZ06_04185 [Tissierellia bacterium]|nr:hypothetical protein [Tissierellia bacterium]
MDVENKRNSNKIIFLLISFLVIMTMVTLVLLYFKNEKFNTRANTFLKRIPFLKKESNLNLSQIELEDKKKDIAEHLLSLDNDLAAYKLYTIKTKDEVLYRDIVKIMNSKKPFNTEKIIKKLRELQDMDNSIVTIHNEIIKEVENDIIKEAVRLENMETKLAINEIETRIDNDTNFTKRLNEIIKNMDEGKAVNILYYMDEDKREELYELLDEDLKTYMEKLVFNKETQHSRLVDLAGLYENKPIDVLLNEIGSTENYSIDELAVIYSNLSTIKSAEVLSKTDDEIFIQDLFAAMRKEEQLREVESVVSNINSAIKFISEYNEKIAELVKVYERMEPNKVASIMEEMLKNNTTVTQLTIESESIYEITDSKIVVDVFRNMKEKTRSNVINYMTTNNATKLTQMLATP